MRPRPCPCPACVRIRYARDPRPDFRHQDRLLLLDPEERRWQRPSLELVVVGDRARLSVMHTPPDPATQAAVLLGWDGRL
jgi:hypothetical protein